jgi:hypothetical protein
MTELTSESMPIRATVVETLRAAAADQLPRGWLFLPEGEIAAETKCVIFTNVDVGHVQPLAARLGFPIYGLDTGFLKIVVEGEEDRVYGAAPSDKDLMCAYLAQLELEEKSSAHFYELLGEERADVPCRNPACRRGAIALSVFCRRHHFEVIQRRPCPVDYCLP